MRKLFDSVKKLFEVGATLLFAVATVTFGPLLIVATIVWGVGGFQVVTFLGGCVFFCATYFLIRRLR